jgi:chromosome partitioning protein
LESNNLIGISEVAKVAGVSAAAVSNWRSRYTDFPAPLVEMQSGPVFDKTQILDWLNRRNGNMPITISLFNNKGGVGKTTTLWNLSVSLAAKDKRVLVIDFDPQCNFSIACLGGSSFASCLGNSPLHPFGQTIKSFALPYVQQSQEGKIYTKRPKEDHGNIDVVPGDFWLNNFSDILNVGTDVIGGAGLYRFLTPARLVTKIQFENQIKYDYVLIDLPPSFNSLVRSALYSSDYFIVPCTADLFSAYCVGLIGDMLPLFIRDWQQGKERYLQSNEFDEFIKTKGMPQFGGWIFNGFDTRKARNAKLKTKLGADEAQFQAVRGSITDRLMTNLREKVGGYTCVPEFVSENPIGQIEDLNVMAPDSIVQSVPIKYLSDKRPTRENYSSGKWARNQIELMKEMDKQYDMMADFVISNFVSSSPP